MGKYIKLDVQYQDFYNNKVSPQHGVKSIIIFNYSCPTIPQVIAHRTSYKPEHREDAVGAWHVKPKII
tara:strand:- start:936 stop:1139 length:204 start_codon:yes stop_codon:yes gene_type:complete